MKLELPMPIIAGVLIVVLGIAGWMMWQNSVPHRPANAHSAAEGIRADIAKRRGLNPAQFNLKDKRRD